MKLMKQRPKRSAASLLTAVLVSSPIIANAADANLSSTFSVYFKGIPVATMKNKIVINGTRYKIDGSARTNKAMAIIASSKGSMSASGKISGTKVIPSSQNASFRRGKKKGETQLTFAGANVVKIAYSPKIKIKPDTIPLKDSHSKNVLDPVSALIFPVADGGKTNGKEVCNRSVPVFDGKVRMNLEFSYKGEGTDRPAGYNGPVYRCAVKYVPVAGHRKSNKGTNFLKTRKDIEVQMGRVGSTDVFSLVGFKVPTRFGMIEGNATKLALR
ncbi:DUF3108 domain-containing protein [Pseudahrensia aquimaris]|uniref:DUF3108 domain-containing protein n=1 Tax=Pseudahrensia aquimaris TaxID=744461 RepID=A0ABW3F9X7_9HYPH